MSRYIVCGGRDYTDWVAVFYHLDRLHSKTPITAIIHGDAPGADTHAKDWATERGVMHLPFPAEWDKFGDSAGPRRNQQMIDEAEPDGLIAFPGGWGTADMIRRAQKAGLKVWRPEE